MVSIRLGFLTRLSFWLCLGLLIISALSFNVHDALITNKVAKASAVVSQKSKPSTPPATMRMPFPGREMWNGDYTYTMVDGDKWGAQFDMSKPANASGTIIAPTDGKVNRFCTVGEATGLRLETAKGDVFAFKTLKSTTAVVDLNTTTEVKRGDYLGMLMPEGQYVSETCNLTNRNDHLLFDMAIRACPTSIDSYTIGCKDLKDCVATKIISPACSRSVLGVAFASTNQIAGLDIYNKSISLLSNTEFRFGSKNNDELVGLPIILKQIDTIGNEGWYYNTESQQIRGPNGMCADSGDVDSNVNRWLRVADCNGLQNQRWELDSQNRLSSKVNWEMCIDAVGGANQDATLSMRPCNDSVNQQWILGN
jgi:hypothetical protein